MPIDDSAEAIDRRLRQASLLAKPLLAAQRGPEVVRAATRCAVVDLSPAAVDCRLREVSALRRLCLDLACRDD